MKLEGRIEINGEAWALKREGSIHFSKEGKPCDNVVQPGFVVDPDGTELRYLALRGRRIYCVEEPLK